MPIHIHEPNQVITLWITFHVVYHQVCCSKYGQLDAKYRVNSIHVSPVIKYLWWGFLSQGLLVQLWYVLIYGMLKCPGLGFIWSMWLINTVLYIFIWLTCHVPSYSNVWMRKQCFLSSFVAGHLWKILIGEWSSITPYHKYELHIKINLLSQSLNNPLLM